MNPGLLQMCHLAAQSVKTLIDAVLRAARYQGPSNRFTSLLMSASFDRDKTTLPPVSLVVFIKEVLRRSRRFSPVSNSPVIPIAYTLMPLSLRCFPKFAIAPALLIVSFSRLAPSYQFPSVFAIGHKYNILSDGASLEFAELALRDSAT